jgi:hypothetical protein
MDKVWYVGICFLLSSVLALTWGGFIYWFMPRWGITVGSVFFLACFFLLMKGFKDFDEPEVLTPQERFNEL